MTDDKELTTDEKIQQAESYFAPNPCRADMTVDGLLRVEVTDKNGERPSQVFGIPDPSDYRTRDELHEALKPLRELLLIDGYEFG